jgi:hypothetical protein
MNRIKLGYVRDMDIIILIEKARHNAPRRRLLNKRDR